MDKRPVIIEDAAAFLSSWLDGRKPVVGIILGSGLGELANEIEGSITIPYVMVPGFPAATAVGHKGNFICGMLGGKCVLAMQGRYHYYEGYPMDTVVLPIRVMIKLGIEYLLVSNAAGAMNKSYSIGDLMLIRDHINLLPNPLIGPNLDDFGPRFPDMTCAYDLELQERMLSIAKKQKVTLRRGIYVSCTGPTYETPAEYAFYKAIGGDDVGMSVTPEVIVARHAGIRVLGMSVITDVAHEAGDGYVTDENEIVRQADLASKKMTGLFRELISTL
ncbi:MAG: purine-nucleoside phosphorylase [Bacteroidales bacterium]|nr:purine-nucleoside phosphorylase [Bacteroidales bacterium]